MLGKFKAYFGYTRYTDHRDSSIIYKFDRELKKLGLDHERTLSITGTIDKIIAIDASLDFWRELEKNITVFESVIETPHDYEIVSGINKTVYIKWELQAMPSDYIRQFVCVKGIHFLQSLTDEIKGFAIPFNRKVWGNYSKRVNELTAWQWGVIYNAHVMGYDYPDVQESPKPKYHYDYKPTVTEKILSVSAQSLQAIPHENKGIVTLYSDSGYLGYVLFVYGDGIKNSGVLEHVKYNNLPMVIKSQTIKDMAKSYSKGEILEFHSTDNDKVIFISSGFTKWYIQNDKDNAIFPPTKKAIAELDMMKVSAFYNQLMPFHQNNGDVINPAIMLSDDDNNLWFAQITDGRVLLSVCVGKVTDNETFYHPVGIESKAFFKTPSEGNATLYKLSGRDTYSLCGVTAYGYNDGGNVHPKIKQYVIKYNSTNVTNSIVLPVKSDKRKMLNGLDVLTPYHKKQNIRYFCESDENGLKVTVQTASHVSVSNDISFVIPIQHGNIENSFYLFPSAFNGIGKNKIAHIQFLDDGFARIGNLIFSTAIESKS